MDVANTEGDNSQISVCGLLKPSSALEGLIQEILDPRHYSVTLAQTSESFLGLSSQQYDCLIIEDPAHYEAVFPLLENASVLLPSVLLLENLKNNAEVASSVSNGNFFYHPAEIKFDPAGLKHDLAHAISQAVANFMRLATIARVDRRDNIQAWFSQPSLQQKLMQQQMRLSQKLKERLGYLGVYYKRDPNQFIRNLDPEDRQELIADLRSEYRQIILSYFKDDADVNSMLDTFVTKAFFADISVTWIMEMHMELMDVFAKKLKLEGRSDDVLLDYRLTLIDAIAHLAEMYRLSIPKEG